MVDRIVSCEDEAYDVLINDMVNGDDDEELDEDQELNFEFPNSDGES